MECAVIYGGPVRALDRLSEQNLENKWLQFTPNGTCVAIRCQDELCGHSLLGVCFGNEELGHCMCKLYPFIKIRKVLNVCTELINLWRICAMATSCSTLHVCEQTVDLGNLELKSSTLVGKVYTDSLACF